MLAVLGASLIGAAHLILLAVILASRAGRARWLARAEVAERIATALIAGFAVGMGCIALHGGGRPGTARAPSRPACCWRRCSASP